MVGSYLSVPSHRDFNPSKFDGSILLPTFGQGSDSLTNSFITIGLNAAMKGFVIYYPKQICNTNTQPLIYPPTLYLNGSNAAIQDVELLNSWIGIVCFFFFLFFFSKFDFQIYCLCVSAFGKKKATIANLRNKCYKTVHKKSKSSKNALT